jgi:hypothetical protein
MCCRRIEGGVIPKVAVVAEMKISAMSKDHKSQTVTNE